MRMVEFRGRFGDCSLARSWPQAPPPRKSSPRLRTPPAPSPRRATPLRRSRKPSRRKPAPPTVDVVVLNNRAVALTESSRLALRIARQQENRGPAGAGQEGRRPSRARQGLPFRPARRLRRRHDHRRDGRRAVQGQEDQPGRMIATRLARPDKTALADRGNDRRARWRSAAGPRGARSYLLAA